MVAAGVPVVAAALATRLLPLRQGWRAGGRLGGVGGWVGTGGWVGLLLLLQQRQPMPDLRIQAEQGKEYVTMQNAVQTRWRMLFEQIPTPHGI